MKPSLYSWQEDCLSVWKNNHYRGIIKAVTGTGKTYLACSAISMLLEQFPNLHVRIVVPTIPLARQWKEALIHYFQSDLPEIPGLFYGAEKDSANLPFLIYVINSARDFLPVHAISDIKNEYPLFLLCDECHHYTSRENRKIFRFITQELKESGSFFSLGMSATPFTGENDSILTEAMGAKIYDLNFSSAVKQNTISSFVIGEIETGFLPDELKKYLELSDTIRIAFVNLLRNYPFLKSLSGRELTAAIHRLSVKADSDPSDPAVSFLMLLYRRKEISLLASSRNLCVMDLIFSLPDHKRIIIFCERIDQARKMFRSLSDYLPHSCGIYHSELIASVKKHTLDEFRKNHTRILICCKCLDEGINIPDADVGIVLSTSAVERQRVQRLGRIIRRSTGKEQALLYYVYIRESGDEAIYLENESACPRFHLRYDSGDRSFSNRIYEEKALLLLQVIKEKGYSLLEQNEVKQCILDGLTRGDCYFTEEIYNRKIHSSADTHMQNYWRTQKQMAKLLLP